jgi:hypothetical protein
MKNTLAQPMTKGELLVASKELAKAKATHLNIIVAKFFQKIWLVIGQEYTQMVQVSIQKRSFPPKVIEGVIKLFHKEGKNIILSNKQPIMLINVTYNFS